MSLAPGTKLGPYEICAALGAGGMGEVYRARDTRLERTVAIKILPAQFTADQISKQRFEREAKTISLLNHPHICVLYDIGHQEGIDYIVMECVEGETLATRLEKGPLSLDQTLKYGAQIAEALDRAHRSGIVHRDLKPGNIMLTPTGAKLLDFGLAKEVMPLANLATLTTAMATSPVTQQGTIVGTFQYMSPEQIEGKAVDGRSDLFSLGAVLYEALTGRRAFEGKTQLSVASAILERDPEPLSVAKPVTPPALQHAIQRCLAKDPEERWQTGRDLAGELKWIAAGSSQAGTAMVGPSKTKWRERALWGLAGLLAIVTAFLGYAYVHRPTTSQPGVRSSILPPPKMSIPFGTGIRLGGFAFSPDGSRLVLNAQGEDGKVSLWVRPLNSLTAQELAGTEDGFLPFWSADGKWIGFFAQGKLKKIPASGGPVQELCDAPQGRGGSWNSNGDIVFAPAISSPLFRISANGGVPTKVTELDATLGETTHRWPEFLPDGEHFLYLARQLAENKPAGIFVASLRAAPRKKLMDHLTEAQYAPGYLLFVHNNTLLAKAFDVENMSLKGEAMPVAGDVANEASFLRAGFSVSQAGQLVYRSADAGTDMELIALDRSGKRLYTFPTEGIINSFGLSPDGQRLALTEILPTKSGSTIWLYDLHLNTRTRFTFGGGMNGSPTWSPDGSELAFSSARNGTFNIFVKPVTGAAEETVLHLSNEDERPQSFSPDGKNLIIDYRPQTRLGTPEIALLPLTGERKVSSLLNVPYMNNTGKMSPDGHWLLYSSMESGRAEVYVTSFPGLKGKWQVSSSGGSTPQWRHDGQELYFINQNSFLMAAEVKASNGSFVLGAVKQLWERRVNSDLFQGQYAVSPDGQRFYVSAMKERTIHSPLTLLNNWPAELNKRP
jgi:eukaryotic-like serine/threonine-protein kinase